MPGYLPAFQSFCPCIYGIQITCLVLHTIETEGNSQMRDMPGWVVADLRWHTVSLRIAGRAASF